MNRETIGIAMMVAAIVFAFVELPFGYFRDRRGDATLAWWGIFGTLTFGGFLLSTVMT